MNQGQRRDSHPPIDDELRETVWPDVTRALLFDLGADQIPAMREEQVVALPTDEFLRDGGKVDLERRRLPGAPGAPDLTALILRPAGGTGRQPCLYYTSNAGKVFRSPELALTAVELGWIVEFGVALVSIAGRVGPEDPHPALLDDAYAGLRWIAANADDLGVDPDRIMLIGKSGGGGVAAATALYARDHGGPPVSHQLLLYPMLDDRQVTPSSRFDGVPWDRATNHTGWRAILGDAVGGPTVSPYAAPARETNLRGLPPAYLEVGSSDGFRDEVIAYALGLAAAEIPVELHSWAGGFHGFDLAGPNSELARAAIAARTSYLRRALRPRPGTDGVR